MAGPPPGTPGPAARGDAPGPSALWVRGIRPGPAVPLALAPRTGRAEDSPAEPAGTRIRVMARGGVACGARRSSRCPIPASRPAKVGDVARQFVGQLENEPGRLASQARVPATRGIDMRHVGGAGAPDRAPAVVAERPAPPRLNRWPTTPALPTERVPAPAGRRLHPPSPGSTAHLISMPVAAPAPTLATCPAWPGVPRSGRPARIPSRAWAPGWRDDGRE